MLEEKLNRTAAPAWYCARTTDAFRVVWLSLTEAARPVCLLDELAVFYDATTGRSARQACSWPASLGATVHCCPALDQLSNGRDTDRFSGVASLCVCIVTE